MFRNSSIKQSVLKKVSKLKTNSLFQKFIDSFYSYVPIDDKKIYDTDEFYAIAKLMYKNIAIKKPKKFKVDIYPGADIHKNYKDDIIITIINDDMPFLVDSITELLNKRQYKIQHMINSVLCIRRSSDGDLQDIKACEGSPNESAIYIKISLPKDSEVLGNFKADLNKILSHVSISVQDWKAILEKIDESINILSDDTHPNNSEERDFLEWLKNDNFIFIGYKKYSINGSGNIKSLDESALGVMSLKKQQELDSCIIKDIFHSNGISSEQKMLVGKIKEISKVHRYSSLDYICTTYEHNKVIYATVFLGLFTTKIDYQSVLDIPLISSKVKLALDKAGFDERSFNSKELFSIIETLPRDELFQLSKDELFLTSMMILSSLNNPRLLFFVRENKCTSFLNLLIFFPRTRITPDIIEKVQNVLRRNIVGKFISSSLKLSSMGLAYIYVSMKIRDNRKLEIDIMQIESELDASTKQWNENLDIFLEQAFESKQAAKLFQHYKKSFPTNYKAHYSCNDSVKDISYIEKLSEESSIAFNLYQEESAKRNHFKIKIYTLGEQIKLHQIMPVLDNLGFYALDENVFKVDTKRFNRPVWIKDFSVYVDSQTIHQVDDIKLSMENTLMEIIAHNVANDPLNSLVMNARITCRETFLLRAYCKYLIQIKFQYSHEFVRHTLISNHYLTKLIIDLFNYTFDPELVESNSTKIQSIRSAISSGLSKVVNNAEDRVLSKLLELIDNTLRTNFFQKKNGHFKDYVSFKFNSNKISDIPLPKPYAEIFVHSVRAEGIHLRGDKISRGGLRWSDRVEDYRTEVLGLMKAQMTKNPIIVPQGSKGGFLVKNAEHITCKDELQQEAIECYKIFLRGMLDVTDNIVDGKVKKPAQVVCLDGDDPYLVIAADKGTATFSDIANSLSEEYDFWLGDAFASGGASGYDHKKMGITAKGAWVSVIEHFRSINMDPAKDEFTVIGIGGMSGDVFGNGMLLSKKIKLVAAFNHINIFVDPDPSPEKSYKERNRLFKTNGSSWDDYDSALLSKGGGVFSRYSKSIKISKQIQNLLEIKESSVEPDYLIRKILMAKVDLLWNGGIGTYVKAKSELNEQIGNKSNDSVRVNGEDLRCKIISEGGNLGFTQLGRIEYCFNGGIANTDFIDNSAGVDCSDHEVNIKICLNSAVESNKISLNERNNILSKMQDEVAKLVLLDNELQNHSISIATHYSVEDFDYYIKLIKTLEDQISLNTELEFLPAKMEITKRSQDSIGFTRPEISVLLSYSKMAIYNDIIKSELPDDKYYQKFLLEYFPADMQSRFESEILSHRLKREIVATSVANDIVNNLGIFAFHIIQGYSAVSGCDIIRTYSVIWKIFGIKEIYNKIYKVKNNNMRIELFHTMHIFMQNMIYWFLRNLKHPLDVSATVEIFSSGIQSLASKSSSFVGNSLSQDVKTKKDYYHSNGVDNNLSGEIANLAIASSYPDIILSAQKSNTSYEDAAKIFFILGEKFYYQWLISRVEKLPEGGYWQKMLIKTLKDDTFDQQRELCNIVSSTAKSDISDKIETWLCKNSNKVKVFYDFVDSIKLLDNLDHAKLVIAVKQIKVLTS